MQNLIQLTDDQLVALYSNGNTKAFDTLLSRYQDKLYSYINFVVRNRDLADDIFQDTFVKAIVTLQKGSYTSTGKFGAWLTRIAHNLIIDYFRQDKNENTVSNDAQEYDLLNDASLAESNVEDTMINEQTLRDVRRLVDALPDNQREVVFMRYYQDLSFKEIAVHKPIEKITIKEITDKAGVIRPTFYNHFQDKYELLEWIVKQELIFPMKPLIQEKHIKEAVTGSMNAMLSEKVFYTNANKLSGQNSFREILRACLTNGKSRPNSGTPSVSRPITEKETATSSSRALQSLSMKTRKTTRSRKKARRSAIPAPADSAG